MFEPFSGSTCLIFKCCLILGDIEGRMDSKSIWSNVKCAKQCGISWNLRRGKVARVNFCSQQLPQRERFPVGDRSHIIISRSESAIWVSVRTVNHTLWMPWITAPRFDILWWRRKRTEGRIQRVLTDNGRWRTAASIRENGVRSSRYHLCGISSTLIATHCCCPLILCSLDVLCAGKAFLLWLILLIDFCNSSFEMNRRSSKGRTGHVLLKVDHNIILFLSCNIAYYSNDKDIDKKNINCSDDTDMFTRSSRHPLNEWAQTKTRR